MTKIFSAVFFTICLVGTWYLVGSRPTIGYETHSDMQASLVQVITQFLNKEKPNAREFSILELKSEVLSPNSVRVYFQYQFSEPDINGAWLVIQRSGAAELMRAASQNPGEPERWQIRSGRVITKEGLVYDDALRITPGADDSTSSDSPTPAPNAAPTGTAAASGSPAASPTPAPAATGGTGH